MPPKRKSTEANIGLENQLPSISELLKEHPLSDENNAKRARTDGAPLADISNSPLPIRWTAFGDGPSGPNVKTVPYDYQPLKSLAARAVTMPYEKAVAPPTLPVPAPVPSSTVVPTNLPPTAQPKPRGKSAAKSKGPIPVVVSVPPAPIPTSAAAPVATSKPSKPPKKNNDPAGLPDVSDIHLEGESTDSVPIFDTCDVIRRKITNALTSTPHTKASLLRALAACTSTPEKPIPATSFQHFMNAKGKVGGVQSRVFYAGYVYFEKVRIVEGKKKGKVREEMESAWGRGGIDKNAGKPMWCGPGEMVVMDKYGREEVIWTGPGRRM
ncbi:hypothetical protein ABW19_dt0206753 [Dactylella cylindrospora]|nr:hypothetical protein ABW19_dt0206753 [Dactylella cylindrospora]